MSIAQAASTTTTTMPRRTTGTEVSPSAIDAERTLATPRPVRGAALGPTFLDVLAHLLAAPIDDASRERVDAALGLLAGSDGARMAHLLPQPDTPDVVRHRIAGRALVRLARDHEAAQDVARRAIDLLRT